MKHLTDTIFATSNQNIAAIKIIRISGKAAHKIPKIFNFKHSKPRKFELKKLIHSKTLIDIAPVLWLPEKKSYTGEDTYELHIHGSNIIEKLIYETLGNYNEFRQAEPGEFTRRAYLNGKLDLLQAESINDIIFSQTEEQLRLGQNQLLGSLSKDIAMWRDHMIELSTLIEALIDFSDEEIPDTIKDEFIKKREKIYQDINTAVKNAKFSTLIRDGFSVVIIGKPNVGKSSLINSISKENIAIVSDLPGTTRDVIKQKVNLNGMAVNFYDTAGLRKTSNIVEKQGIDLALEFAKNCQIVLNLSENNNFSLPKTFEEALLKHKVKVLNIQTKADIMISKSEDADLIVSSKKLLGIDKLLNTISNLLSDLEPRESTLLTSERQVKNSLNVLKSLKKSEEFCVLTETELVAEELREAVKHLGKITCSIDNEEILDQIFGSFCIGK